MNLQSIIDVAKRAATKSMMRNKHGAALFLNSKLIAVGHNISLGKHKSIHAEQNVLRKIPKGIKSENLTLVVVRINRFGQLMNSKPCNQCERLIIQSKVNALYS